MTTDYVSDSHMVRWITLWIYSFHMPAFIFLSGLVHKRYVATGRAAAAVGRGAADGPEAQASGAHGQRLGGSLLLDPVTAGGESRMRWDKIWGYFLCAYGLKIFLQFTRTLMGQNPLWHWIQEPGIPWYLFVMAEYELLFYVMRWIDGGAGKRNDRSHIIRPLIVIAVAFALSAAAGYFPAIDDTFCLSRMINFLPIYMLGYYMDMRKFGSIINKSQVFGWLIIISSLLVCYFGNWQMYRWRKWFTGRRSYEFLQEYFSYAVKEGWWVRIAVWAVALAITFSIIAVIPDRDLGFITKIGSRTLQVYFWHRPVCYLFRTLKVLPRLVVMFGGTYDESIAGDIPGKAFGGGMQPMLAGLTIYIIIGIALTAFFSLRIFEHPTRDLMNLGKKLGRL